MINRNDLRKIRHLLPIDCFVLTPDRKGKWLINRDFLRYLSVENPCKPIGSLYSLIPLEEDRQWVEKQARRRLGMERRKLTLDPILTGKKSVHCYFFGQLTGSLFLFRFNTDDRIHQALRIPEDDRHILFPLLYRGIAEDLKNPLALLTRSLQELKESLEENGNCDQLKKKTETSLSQTEKINDLIQAFLEFQRGSDYRKDTFSLNSVIHNVLILTRSNWKDHVEIRAEIPEEEVILFGDKFLIERALFNLVVNGCQAMDQGKGILQIRTEETTEGCRISVSNDGPGLEPREQEKVFLPGYTTRESSDGLGLPLAKQIVEEFHGGRLTLSSAAGKGTEFTIFLPSETAPVV
ncbi:MAG: ATP-binding protein [Spirochaetales bacterium]|nr:ATP-binding protein [Spirochaetales bacterium]